MEKRTFDSSRVAGAALVLAFAILYLATLDNGLRPGELEGGDLITHQYAQVQGRPSNAPGYPLYTMGGWLWFHAGRILLGSGYNPILILSSYSTLWALLAVWLLYRLILEITERNGRGNWPVAALATAFYGVSYFFWYYAVTTEQYTSAVAWTLAVIYLAFRWQRVRADRYLLAIALLVGVGLAHMLTVLFIVPPLVWFFLRTDLRPLRRPILIAAAIGVAALPLVSYAFVYLSGAAHPEWQGVGAWPSTWQWFWSFLSTRQGRGELTWSLSPFLTAEYPALIWREMTLPGLVLGLLGLAALPRRRAIFLYATIAIYLAFSWVDRLGNWFQVVMPVYAILVLGMAGAADWAWRWGRRGAGAQRTRRPERLDSPPGSNLEQTYLRQPERVKPDCSTAAYVQRRIPRRTFLMPAVVLVVLGALVIYRGIRSYPLADSSNRLEDTGLAPGWAILADEPPQGTRVLGTTPEALALDYLAEIWGARPDVRAVTSAQAREILAAGSPVLAVTEAALPLVPEEVSPDARFSSLGGRLIEIRLGPGYTIPAGGPAWHEQPWQHDFGSVLRLIGGRARRDAQSGETAVLLAWQAPARAAEDWSVSVRLLQGEREVAQLDREHPVAGAYPTNRWSPGEVVGDGYVFAVPPGTAPDGVRVVVYRAAPGGGFENLDVAQFPLRLEDAAAIMPPLAGRLEPRSSR